MYIKDFLFGEKVRTPKGVGGVKTPVKHPPSGAAKPCEFSQNQKSNAQNRASFRKIKNQTPQNSASFRKIKNQTPNNLLQIAIKRYGGNAKKDMNGKQS